MPVSILICWILRIDSFFSIILAYTPAPFVVNQQSIIATHRIKPTTSTTGNVSHSSSNSSTSPVAKVSKHSNSQSPAETPSTPSTVTPSSVVQRGIKLPGFDAAALMGNQIAAKTPSQRSTPQRPVTTSMAVPTGDEELAKVLSRLRKVNVEDGSNENKTPSVVMRKPTEQPQSTSKPEVLPKPSNNVKNRQTM